MGAEILQERIEIYRFKEREGTYFSACILKYKGETVEVKGLSGAVDFSCMSELRRYLRKQRISKMHYTVKNREVIRNVGCDTRFSNKTRDCLGRGV